MRRVATLVCALVLATFVLPSRAVAATVTTSWAVGVEPFGVTIDPRDGKAYVAISNHFNTTGSENMWVVDPTVPPPWNPPGNMPVLISLPSPQVMSVLDTSLDRLFVTSSPLAVVDVPSHSVIATVPGVRGAGIALDPATHHVFVATLSGAALVDGVSGAVLAQRSAPSASDVWWQVAHDPQRHRVYVANGNFTGAPSLVVLDDSDLSVIRTVPLPAIPRLALAVDSARGIGFVGGLSRGSAGPGRLDCLYTA